MAPGGPKGGASGGMGGADGSPSTEAHVIGSARATETDGSGASVPSKPLEGDAPPKPSGPSAFEAGTVWPGGAAVVHPTQANSKLIVTACTPQ